MAFLAGRAGITPEQSIYLSKLTVKSVETHLSHAYRRLDIASRSQLSEALRRDGKRDDYEATPS